MDDKDLLASAKVGKKGYLWLDCSYIDKWGDNRWSVVVRGKVHPIERDANGDRIFYPTAEAAARALFDAGYGPAKCQSEKPKLPLELRQALEWMDDDILPGMEAFGNVYAPLRAWCEAHFDCSLEPPIPPKPPALEPFEIVNGERREWANAEDSRWFILNRNDGTRQLICKSDGWQRVEEKP